VAEHPCSFLFLIPLIPFVVGFANGLIGRYLPRIVPGASACLAMALSLWYSTRAVFWFYGAPSGTVALRQDLWTWMSSGGLDVSFSLMADQLTCLMIVMISVVGFLIHLYSLGYMEHEKDQARYFSQLNLFAGFMFLLVMATNFPVMFIGWEGVGACSYLLIGYYFSSEDKAQAGKKAFLVNRVGDASFLVGVLVLLGGLSSAGGPLTLEFSKIKARIGALAEQRIFVDLITPSEQKTPGFDPEDGGRVVNLSPSFSTPERDAIQSRSSVSTTTSVLDRSWPPTSGQAVSRSPSAGVRASRGVRSSGDSSPNDSGPFSASIVTVVALLLFLGATGKSAQIPLYVWLPDAMAGPTPVSALIHAATMVTAGVYMVCRLCFLFTVSDTAMAVVAWTGALTALLAGIIALAQRDIKKILAYSTISQLGFMFLAAGSGAFSAAIFHVFTHAFFKALLFLGAGSVIHALHGEQDIFNMGGLRKKLPWTYRTFLIGALALCGFPPLAGFFSKDQILFQVYSSPRGGAGLYLIAIFTAILTAFYMFRLVSLVFWSESRVDRRLKKTIHEAPPSMLLPLVILAAGTVIVGFLNTPGLLYGHEWLSHALDPVLGESSTQLKRPEPFLEFGLMIVSILVGLIGILTAWWIYTSPERDDTLAEFEGTLAYRAVLAKFGVDEAYDLVIVRPLLAVSRFLRTIVDETVVDGALVNGVARLIDRVASVFRELQSGDTQRYLLLLTLGTTAVIVYLMRSF